jgi:Holliday junction resolvase RusA-like endonuclease
MLKDVMTDMGFWKDDALICREYVQKMYSDEPGIIIGIYDDMNLNEDWNDYDDTD